MAVYIKTPQTSYKSIAVYPKILGGEREGEGGQPHPWLHQSRISLGPVIMGNTWTPTDTVIGGGVRCGPRVLVAV